MERNRIPDIRAIKVKDNLECKGIKGILNLRREIIPVIRVDGNLVEILHHSNNPLHRELATLAGGNLPEIHPHRSRDSLQSREPLAIPVDGNLPATLLRLSNNINSTARQAEILPVINMVTFHRISTLIKVLRPSKAHKIR